MLPAIMDQPLVNVEIKKRRWRSNHIACFSFSHAKAAKPNDYLHDYISGGILTVFTFTNFTTVQLPFSEEQAVTTVNSILSTAI